MFNNVKGYEIILGPALNGKKYFVEEVDETPCLELLSKPIRHVVNLAIYEQETRTKLKGTYPGEVTLRIGYRPRESGHNVYLYNTLCLVVKEYPNKSLSKKNSGKFGSKFEGYFEIIDDTFPDPNVGVGP